MAAPVAQTTTREAITGRMSGVVYDRIVDMIATGTFPLNTRLPAEQELSERFEASRPVVREALQRLRDDGLIISRQGSGSYVKRRPEADVLQLVPVGSLADIQRCFEFRAGLEPAAAALAALRREDSDLERLAAAMQVFRRERPRRPPIRRFSQFIRQPNHFGKPAPRLNNHHQTAVAFSKARSNLVFDRKYLRWKT